uniref:Defensin-3 n=2 Tax=Papio TaxID=9554 RepID=DEF3_PAPHA|nr:RecName: Full=Defensin-3; AltName: Full=PhD3 [Papio hamadryas]
RTCRCRLGRCSRRESYSGSCNINGRIYSLCCR